MSDIEIYNKILRQVSDRITETLVEFQAELEIQRLERDRAIRQADINQRKYQSVNEDLQQLRAAYDRQVNSVNVLFTELNGTRLLMTGLRAELAQANACLVELEPLSTRTENDQLRARMLELEAELQRMRNIDRAVMEANELRRYPHYTSTYCIHGLHDQCRRTCKTCGSACRCSVGDCLCNSPVEWVELNEAGQTYVDEHPEVPIPPEAEPIP
jgi:hypothetical protein